MTTRHPYVNSDGFLSLFPLPHQDPSSSSQKQPKNRRWVLGGFHSDLELNWREVGLKESDHHVAPRKS